MNPTSTTEYDFKKDNAVIAVDHEAGFHDKDLPWVIYLSGVYVAAMDSFQRACEHAEKMGWLGHCTIRDVFAEQPTLGPMFGTGYESGYAAAKAEAADALSSLTRELEEARKQHSTNIAQLLVAIEPFAMAAAGLDDYSEEMCVLRGSVCFSRDPPVHITVEDLRRAHHVNEMVWAAIRSADPTDLSTEASGQDDAG